MKVANTRSKTKAAETLKAVETGYENKNFKT